MTSPPPILALRYLGGCPGHSRPEPVQVTVWDDRLELRARGWGWRIGFASVTRVGEPRQADGDGPVLPVEWASAGGVSTLLLAGRDAARMRFLLAQAVAAEHLARQLPPAPLPVRAGATRAAGRLPGGRGAGPWARELRRMRTVTGAALVVALTALVLIVGVTLVVLGRERGGSHWTGDRALLTRQADDLQVAQQRNDAGALARALTALQEQCARLETYNGEAGNTGDDFNQAQSICATVGILLQ